MLSWKPFSVKIKVKETSVLEQECKRCFNFSENNGKKPGVMNWVSAPDFRKLPASAGRLVTMFLPRRKMRCCRKQWQFNGFAPCGHIEGAERCAAAGSSGNSTVLPHAAILKAQKDALLPEAVAIQRFCP
ncbi:MAG: hypothetical protein Q4F41_19715, partial [Eubacteriales bacterium]|nr:hypothetical protein [Eubacteriales bacterium]